MVQIISENGTLSKLCCSLEHSVCNPGLSETEVLYEFKSSKHELACVAGVHFQKPNPNLMLLQHQIQQVCHFQNEIGFTYRTSRFVNEENILPGAATELEYK